MIEIKKSFFGAKDKHWDFDPMLIKCTRFAPNGRILDLGLGKNGRNALFFSMLGYKVDGVDIDELVVKQSIERARELGVNINAWVDDISTVDIEEGEYSIILATYMWQYFPREVAERIVAKIKRALPIGGVVYIALFSSGDICFERAKRDPDFKLIGTNTYYAEKGQWWSCQTSSNHTYVHCFTRDDILYLFADFEQLHYSESVDMDIDHSVPHYHNVIVYIGRKMA